MEAASQQVQLERRNDYISYQSNDSQNNHRNRDEEMNTCRKQGKTDICEDYPFWVYPEQIGVNKYGIGIFDCQTYLCHIYKVNESCTEGNNVI